MIISQLDDIDVRSIRRAVYILSGVLLFLAKHEFVFILPAPFYEDAQAQTRVILESQEWLWALKCFLFYFLVRLSIEAIVPIASDVRNTFEEFVKGEEQTLLETKEGLEQSKKKILQQYIYDEGVYDVDDHTEYNEPDDFEHPTQTQTQSQIDLEEMRHGFMQTQRRIEKESLTVVIKKNEMIEKMNQVISLVELHKDLLFNYLIPVVIGIPILIFA